MDRVVLRDVLRGLAIWWRDHPDVPPKRVVAGAMNFPWIGFQRLGEGEAWAP